MKIKRTSGDPSVYFPGHGRVCYTITPNPEDDGEVALEAWWAETMCSVFPCKTRVERWSDGGWRAFGMRKPHVTALDAALARIANAVT